MKNLPYLLLLILLSACTHPSTKEKENAKVATTVQKDTIMPDDKDSVLIDTYENYKLSKGDLKKLLKENPELNRDRFLQHPDITYYSRTNKNTLVFGSEVGQDNYYVIYAYFLKLKNGEKEYRRQRKTLIEIYQDINSIYWKLGGGGTYFGHQYSRILGYAEYSIWREKNNKDYFIKEYDIFKQKALYIAAFRQHIIDEIAANNTNGLTPDDKRKLRNTSFERVNELDQLISNYFYLKMAQEFQYSNY